MQIMEELGSSALPAGESFLAAAAVERVGESPALPGTAEAQAQKARDEALEKLGIASSMVWGISDSRLVIVRASALGKAKELSGSHHLMEITKPLETKKGVGFGKLGIQLKLFEIPLTVAGKKKDVDELLFTLQQIRQRNRGRWKQA